MPKYNKIHNRFKYNNIHFSFEALKELAYGLIKEGDPFEIEIGRFILDWQDEKSFIEAKTSGSTGTPKSIRLDKQAMVNSAIATGDFFKLKPGNRALLCLPAKYIAGKMMLIRAFALGLELDVVEPKSDLDFNTNAKYDFTAMVPMQLQGSMDKLNNVKLLIVGGAQVSSPLRKAIQPLRTKIYETYGMTETVSHIAVRQINGIEASRPFRTLPEVDVTKDDRGCLVINAPRVSPDKVITNDMVDLHTKTSFEWLGRLDNVINSGGIKVFPEQIENKLREEISVRFFIASKSDKTLGEKVILVLEGNEDKVSIEIFKNLKPFEKPKEIHNVDQFVETPSGKIQRKKTLEKLGIN